MSSTKPDRTWSSDLPREPLSIQTVRDRWSRTYNSEGKPDWSHILPYYHRDIVFQDSVQRIDGIGDFTAMCHRLTKRCEKLNMDILAVAQNGADIFLQWKMVMEFRRSPATPVYGATKLTLDTDGMITHQRDYYDLWGDIFNGVPGWRRIYRKALKRFFG